MRIATAIITKVAVNSEINDLYMNRSKMKKQEKQGLFCYQI